MSGLPCLFLVLRKLTVAARLATVMVTFCYPSINRPWPLDVTCHSLTTFMTKAGLEEFYSSEFLPHIKYRSALLNCAGQILSTNSSDLIFTNPEDKSHVNIN